MIKIHLHTIGKVKEKWMQEALNEYLKRIQHGIDLQIHLTKTDADLIEETLSLKPLFAFDSEGKGMRSDEFAKFLRVEVEQHPKGVHFVMGGNEGLPAILKERAPLLSLSKMTFTHQMARLLFVEQVYRSYTLWEGQKYHK